MEYRNLGKTGLKISTLSFGSWVTFVNQLNLKKASECMAYAYDNGVNFFDNAEAYASGKSEILMGKIIKRLGWSRDSYIISSKAFWGGDLPTQIGLSKKHLTDACNSALKRLNVEYLDLFFCHRPDPETPIKETVYAMNDLLLQGKILYWGTSEWSSKEINEAFNISKKYNLRGPSMEQPQYNILFRNRFEIEYNQIFNNHKIGSTIWSPLASGLLTGKYLNGIPKKSRFNVIGYEWLKEEIEKNDSKKQINIIKKLRDLASSLNISLAQLSIIWCLKNPNVSSVILGASSIKQLKENLKAIHYTNKVDTTILKKINNF